MMPDLLTPSPPRKLLRDYQEEAVNSIFAYFQKKKGNPLVVMPTACHAKGTGILMYDGTIKKVENVLVGDKLMGPDSKPRKVLNLTNGTQKLWKITPKKGESFVVNSDHILSLKTTNEGKTDFPCQVRFGGLDNISVREYLAKSKSWKHLRKLYKTAVEFDKKSLPIPPWILGAFLGDGSLHLSLSLYSGDYAIISHVKRFARKEGVSVREVDKNGCSGLFFHDKRANCSIPNRLTEKFRLLGLWGTKSSTKFIPHIYKTSNRNDRLQLLAGLIDTDGHYNKKGFDYISKSKILAEDVVFICRSLGFNARKRRCIKTCQGNYSGYYWRVFISGDLECVPTKVRRKQAQKRRQKKRIDVYGFSITPLKRGEFYGFTLSDDHLYLTSDFFVHHNSGKSLVIADFIDQATSSYPGTRITIVSHVSELIVQNAQELAEYCPRLRISFCSDKLGSKDLSGDVVMGTIQSMYKRALKYPHAPDLLLIDEAHLLSPTDDTMYRRFISELKIINPHLKVVGFTATPFRTNHGYLHKGSGRLFTDICYEIGIIDLINRGYLVPLITPTVQTRMDVHGVKMSGGDYVQGELERAVDVDMLTRACVRELIEFGQNRKKWIVYTAGINHCLHVRDEIRKYDIACEMVTGQTPTQERNSILSRFKSGELRCLVNVAVYTTGLNVPGIDLMSFMRPTRSPVLYIQMAGRGMRIAPHKTDCLLLDHGMVVAELGPIDQVRIKEKKPGKGMAPMKYCPECGAENFAGVAQCKDCGYEWPPHELELEKEASNAAVLSTQLQTETHDVQSVFYYRHTKEGRPDSLRVEYLCGPTKSFRQWMLFEHIGRFREEACAWWRTHASTTPPNTITDALAHVGELKKPTKVSVRRVGKYFQIVREEF